MARRVHLQLEIELEQPIRGVVRGDFGVPHRFEGWLELTSAVEAACEAACRPREHERPPAGGTS